MINTAQSSGPIGLTLKAWGLVKNGTTLVKGFNVASAVNGGTGLVTITFTTACATSTYTVKSITNDDTAGNPHDAILASRAAGNFGAELRAGTALANLKMWHFEVWE